MTVQNLKGTGSVWVGFFFQEWRRFSSLGQTERLKAEEVLSVTDVSVSSEK